MITAASRLRRNPKVMFKVFEDEAVLLNVRTGQYYGINDVGARFWELAGEHANMGAIHQALLAEFDVTPEQLWQDLAHLVDELRAAGLLEVDDVPVG